jgi:hypothetical protein
VGVEKGEGTREGHDLQGVVEGRGKRNLLFIFVILVVICNVLDNITITIFVCMYKPIINVSR